MTKILLTVTTLILCAGTVSAQQEPLDSNVPANIRAMIEASQGGNRFEQNARMQMNVQFGEFIAALEGNPRHKTQVQDALVQVLAERAEQSSRVVNGQLNPAEIEDISKYSYLRSRLQPMLNSRELAALDDTQGGSPDEMLRKSYDEQLANSANGLSDQERDLLLDTMVKYMQPDDADAERIEQLSVEARVNEQLSNLMRARMELQPQFDGDKLQQVNDFFNRIQSNLTLNRSMLDDL
jgi:hypothetical protein